MLKFLFAVLCLFTIISCFNSEIELQTANDSNPTQSGYEKEKYYLSTNERVIDEYGTLGKVSLYDLIPNLDDLEITYDNFDKIKKALIKHTEDMPSNYYVLLKETSCNAKIGFCSAEILNVLK